MKFNKNGKLTVENLVDVEILMNNGVSAERIEQMCLNIMDLNNVKLNIPEKYNFINLKNYIKEKSKNLDENYKVRVEVELNLFERSKLEETACVVWYVVDYLKTTQQIYGVGRGSACSVFIFYLLELHRVDSVKYKISPLEFFKLESLV